MFQFYQSTLVANFQTDKKSGEQKRGRNTDVFGGLPCHKILKYTDTTVTVKGQAHMIIQATTILQITR